MGAIGGLPIDPRHGGASTPPGRCRQSHHPGEPTSMATKALTTVTAEVAIHHIPQFPEPFGAARPRIHIQRRMNPLRC